MNPLCHYVPDLNAALQAALSFAGGSPAFMSAADLEWQRRNHGAWPIQNQSTALVVSGDDGCDVYRIRRGIIGPVIARVRMQEE